MCFLLFSIQMESKHKNHKSETAISPVINSSARKVGRAQIHSGPEAPVRPTWGRAWGLHLRVKLLLPLRVKLLLPQEGGLPGGLLLGAHGSLNVPCTQYN